MYKLIMAGQVRLSGNITDSFIA